MKTKAKKKGKASKNVTFDSKKKKSADSDEGSEAENKKQAEPVKPAAPDFVDVIENKGWEIIPKFLPLAGEVHNSCSPVEHALQTTKEKRILEVSQSD